MGWNKIAEAGVPNKDGRYFVLYTFEKNVVSCGKHCRRNVPGVSNFFHGKWTALTDEMMITHWMDVPGLPDEELEIDDSDEKVKEMKEKTRSMTPEDFMQLMRSR